MSTSSHSKTPAASDSLLTPLPTPLTPATPPTLLERDVAAILEIAIELRPLADLLKAPLNESGQGMVVRLLAFLNTVSEELKITQAERLDLAAWKAEMQAQLQGLEALVRKQSKMISEMHALLTSPMR